ncbi:phytanoyl-CoA dioxygenase family protein [Caulobacter sp. KR2-114]|uniref:phytanoyl-CoA dioxygenase family protein n=1 Tax=Caulobacter sp. KR2-114 TaxID=3400912 RepID=UPI003C0DF9CF
MARLQAQAGTAAPMEAVRQLLDQGWCVVADVLTPAESAEALARLWTAAERWRARGNDTHMPVLDPNAANVRVFDLIDLDPLFRDLIRRPVAMALVRALLGPDAMISNFTANIARPGSRSMSLHSDQALVVPEPWLEPWSINIIWCLTDVTPANGATLFIPGSHRVTRRADLGADPGARLVPFEAKAGSIIAMDGRVWHTSGANVTTDQDRALLFGYYSRGFLRPQVNWNAVLSEATQGALDRELRWLLGLDGAANLSLAGELLAADLAGSRRGG